MKIEITPSITKILLDFWSLNEWWMNQNFTGTNIKHVKISSIEFLSEHKTFVIDYTYSKASQKFFSRLNLDEDYPHYKYMQLTLRKYKLLKLNEARRNYQSYPKISE